MSHITREKLKKILDFNENHDRQVENCLAEFEHRTKLVRGCKGFITYAKALLSGEHLEILQIPLKDKELGAIYYNINSKTYIVLNTSLNLANNNFALAHELFHMYFHHCYEGCTDTERYLISYHDNEEDLMANAFAGRFLMPDDSFGQTCHMALMTYDRSERINRNGALSEGEKYVSITIYLMIIFETTYMSVVVRLYELGLLPRDDQMVMETLLKYNDEKALRGIIEKVPNLKGSAEKLYHPELVNDFEQMYALAKTNGEKSVQSEIMDKGYMEYNLDLLKEMYRKVADVGNEVTQHDIC